MNNKKENDCDPVMCYLSIVPDGPVSEEKKEEEKKTEDELRNLMKVDAMCIEIGTDLIPLVDPGRGAKLLDRVTSIRRHIAMELGLLLPGVRFRDDKNLKPESYVIKIRDNVIAEGSVMMNKFLAIAPGKSLDTLEGLRVCDPTFGKPSVWISAGQRGEAEKLGAMIFDPVSVIATQVTEIIRRYAFEMLDYEMVLKMLREAGTYNPLLVEEIYPKSFTLHEIYEVLYNLLRERVPVRDIVTIMETMAQYGSVEIDTGRLTEYVRQSLCHVLWRDYMDSEGNVCAINLDERLIRFLAAFIKEHNSKTFNTDPLLEQYMRNALTEAAKSVSSGTPVFLCPPQIRPFFRKIIENIFPHHPVLSYDEIAPGINVVSITTLSWPDEILDRYNKRENLIVSYIEKFRNDTSPSVRRTAIKMLDSLAGKYDMDMLLNYLNRGLSDDAREVRLEAAVAIKKLFDVKETGAAEKKIRRSVVCREHSCDGQGGESSGEAKQGFSIKIDPISMELGRGILFLVDPNQGGKLVEHIRLIKKEVSVEKGFLLPYIRFSDNLQLKPNEYLIKIKDIVMGSGEIIKNKFLATGTEETVKTLKGQPCIDPNYGRPSVWITSEQREEAEKLGCEIFDHLNVIAIQIRKILYTHAFELLDYGEVSRLMEELKRTGHLSWEEIYPAPPGITQIYRILKNLLRENLSIRDLSLIMRTLKKYVPGDTDILTEYVRQALCRTICRPCQDAQGDINAVVIDEELEKILAVLLNEDSLPAIDRETGEFILSSVKEHLNAFKERKLHPVILCSSRIRRAFRRFIEKSFPDFSVLSYDEIPREINVYKRAVINLPPDILERYRNKDKLIFSYIEKFQKDSEPSIRTMAVKMILSQAHRYDRERLLPYLDAGLKDEDQSVRSEAAGAVKKLLGK
ncbi:MAG: FHIPEP family type III secretion protein [Candidatus Eremiobacterota bacterium]